jgi:hypothetical protein
MSLAQRARKASGLGIEALAPLIGVPWRQLQNWELGKERVPPPFATILRLIEGRPRECVEILEKVNRQRLALRKRVVEVVLELGRGPKRTVPLDELRKATAWRDGPLGREPVPGVDDDEVDGALRALEHSKELVLEPAVDGSTVTATLGQAALRDPKRGLLVYARPGPALDAAAKPATRGAKRPPPR